MGIPKVPAICALRDYASNGKGSLGDVINAVIEAQYVPGGRWDRFRGDLIRAQEPGAPYDDLYAIVTLRGTNPRAVIAASDWMGPDMIPVLAERVKLSTNADLQDAFLRAMERIGGEEAVHAILGIIKRAVRHTLLYNSAFEALNDIALRHAANSMSSDIGYTPSAAVMWGDYRETLLRTPAGRILSHLEEIPGPDAKATFNLVLSALEKSMTESMIQAGVAQG